MEDTNHYAREVLGDSAEAKWVDVVAEDIWAFLGGCSAYGDQPPPTITSLLEPVYHYLPIAERITRDRLVSAVLQE